MTDPTHRQLETAVSNFAQWLGRYGETSYDFQTFYASALGRRAKRVYYRNKSLGVLAVSPIIFCEAFVPSARRFFFIRQRFPIADAHFAMGFASRLPDHGRPGRLSARRSFSERAPGDAVSEPDGLRLGISVRLGGD